VKRLSLLAATYLCLGSAANANPMPLPKGLDYAYCVVAIGRERCAAIAMSRSLCKARIEESRGIGRKISRASNDYLDTLAAMNITGRMASLTQILFIVELLPSFPRSIMYEVCPSVLKSEKGYRPILVARPGNHDYLESIGKPYCAYLLAKSQARTLTAKVKCLTTSVCVQGRDFILRLLFRSRIPTETAK
jgi:hypothetical protein